jgi:hypothetical protein
MQAPQLYLRLGLGIPSTARSPLREVPHPTPRGALRHMSIFMLKRIYTTSIRRVTFSFTNRTIAIHLFIATQTWKRWL